MVREFGVVLDFFEGFGVVLRVFSDFKGFSFLACF